MKSAGFDSRFELVALNDTLQLHAGGGNVSSQKYNPFKPNDIVHAGMFAGRIDELRIIERCLFQAKMGSQQHFMIQGERGIGKSSLLLYVNHVAEGRISPLKGDDLRFVSIPVDLGGCQSQSDIVRKVGRGLRQAIGQRNTLKESAKGVWDWITNWEVLGVKYNKTDNEIDLEEIAEQFVTNLADFCETTAHQVDGLLFLMDEADRPTVESGLGAYLKLISERLTWKGCHKVVFGLAGLPSLMEKLRDSHESSPRLFHTMNLLPLTPEERKRVIQIGLQEANVKNAVQTEITGEAINFLAELSEGYPHFLQQFSYCAFERDTDDVINEGDVGDGAFEDGGALSQLGDKFFNEMYHARISSAEYRRVLDAMAEHGDRWIPRKKIIAESGVTEANVTNALQALKSKGVILQDDKLRGSYRLPTNSFAAWINAVKAARAKSDAQNESPF